LQETKEDHSKQKLRRTEAFLARDVQLLPIQLRGVGKVQVWRCFLS